MDVSVIMAVDDSIVSGGSTVDGFPVTNGFVVVGFPELLGMEEVPVRSSELTTEDGVKGYGSLNVIDPLKMKNAIIVAIREPPMISARLVPDNRGLG